MEPIYTKIVGVTFCNDDGSSRQDIIASLSVGDELRLADCGSDRFPEAIGVFNAFDEQCGNLSKELAQSLRDKDEDFESFIVTVEDVTGGDGRSYGCNICISESNSQRVSVSPQLRQAVQAASVPSDKQPSPGENSPKPARTAYPSYVINPPASKRIMRKGFIHLLLWALFILFCIFIGWPFLLSLLFK